MEIRTEVIENQKELNNEERNELAGKINDWFTEWNDDRQDQISTAREIMQEVYLKQPNKGSSEPDKAWHSDVNLNGLFNIKRAKKALMWREIWANPEQMFDVRGTNEQTEQMAKLQKAAIVDALNKMEVGRQMDIAIDSLYDIGEMVFITDYIATKKVVKRQKKDIGFQLMNVMRNAIGAGYMQAPMKDVEIPMYENARVRAISPFLFTFDASKYKLNDKATWNSCVKIYKRFDTLDNIKANKLYTLTNEQYDDLKAQQEEKQADPKDTVDMSDLNEFGNEFSVLFAHGDFRVGGRVYKNYIAEVVAGKYLIRFEENPMYINPFVYCAIDYDPKTKRGISPLKSVMGMIKEEEKLTNVAFDVQKLTAEPAYLACEGFFDEDNTNKDGTITLAPSKIIEYKNSFSGQIPQPIQVNANGISDLIGMLEQKISDVSSVNANSYGNVVDTKRTATELQLADKGATSQAGKELDTIYQDCTIPLVKNVAELLAMFKDGVEFVYAQDKGKNLEYKITNEIRQAQYEYIYEDRNALNERKSKFEQLYQLASGLAQIPELQGRINWVEIATTGFEMIEFDNTAKFFNEPTPIDQMAEQFKQMPQPVQEQLLPLFQQQGQQAMQQFQLQQMQAQAQQQAQMNIFRQEARNQAENEMMLNNEVI